MAEDNKKIRRQWLFNASTMIISTKEGSFDLSKATEQGMLFLTAYGAKQLLVDKIAGKGGEEYSDVERLDLMTVKYDQLLNKKCILTHTENGFSLKDPDAVVTRSGGIKRSDLVQGLIDSGKHTEEEALAFATKLSQK